MPKDLSLLKLADLARLLSKSEHELTKFIKIAPKLYHKTSIPKKGGKLRKLEIPHKELKEIQANVLRGLLHKMPLHPVLYGGPGTSTLMAARPHIRKSLLLTTDIKDFFPSVKAHQVRNMFLRHGASAELAYTLTRLVTHANHLPQGAPTSPAIGRLVLQPFAGELESVLKNIPRAATSIYVDDVILSGPVGIKRFLPMIRKMLARHGLETNRKTKFMYRSQEQTCLNIRVNDGIAPPTSYLKHIDELALLLPQSDPRLKGKLAYVRSLKS